MKKYKSLIAMLLAIVMTAALLSGCGPSISVETQPPAQNSTPANNDTPDTPDEPQQNNTLTYAPGTVLRTAVGYNNAKTGITFDAEVAGEGITLADGKTYHTGELKPTWVEVQNELNIVFEDHYQGNSASNEFDYWKERLNEVDMLSGTAVKLNDNGVAGNMVNIAEYLDMMPNFKAYLDANPIVRMSITGDTATGAIYFSPYFDGVNDIERMPLMRTDWVEKLLNGEGEFTASASNKTAAPSYQPYMPTSGKVDVDVVKADGSGVEKVTKDYDTAGNIIDKMNAAGSMDGVAAVNMLRTYIDEAYNGYYGTNRADLFVGQNAAWDADELVALLRCVVANPQTLNGTNSVQGLFSREDDNNQRRVDMFRFAGTLFGVRGLESRQEYLYVGNDNQMHDARQEAATYEAMNRMNAMVKEGLISKAFVDMSGENSGTYLENDLGFMHYDYNQTQTLYNATKLNKEGEVDENGEQLTSEKYMAAMVPVARWDDGTGEQFMRFTESWRSVKTDGWGISVAGVGNDQDKLYACLALIDFAYSEKGQVLMSYGPDAFIKTNSDGSYVTFNFNGEQWPEISDDTRTELWDKAGGNYTNYARQYLGSTLSFLKSQAFEYQCTHDVGREGAGYISNAIALGTIKHPELGMASNPWYTIVPTVLPTTKVEKETVTGYTELNEKFNQNKGGENMLLDVILNGTQDPAAQAATVTNDWSGKQYLAIMQGAWERDVAYYDTLK